MLEQDMIDAGPAERPDPIHRGGVSDGPPRCNKGCRRRTQVFDGLIVMVMA